MMPNHRIQKRTQAHAVIHIVDLATDNSIGELVNISEGGFMLKTHHELPLNRLYQLKMPVSMPNDEIAVLEFGAESLWNQQMSANDGYWYGFQIFDISNECIESIRQLESMWS